MPAFLATPFARSTSPKEGKDSSSDEDNEIKEVPKLATLGKRPRDDSAASKDLQNQAKKARSSIVLPIAHTKLPSAMSKMLGFREGTGKENMRKISRVVVIQRPATTTDAACQSTITSLFLLLVDFVSPHQVRIVTGPKYLAEVFCTECPAKLVRHAYLLPNELGLSFLSGCLVVFRFTVALEIH